MSRTKIISSTLRHLVLGSCLLLLAHTAIAADWKIGSTEWTQLPQVKQTKLGLYLSPQQALDMKRADPKGVAFYDIRTPAEANYLGMPIDADALVPFADIQWTDWDEKRNFYKVQPSVDFVPELARRLAAMGLTKASPIVLICRSGDRSARAADVLKELGYDKVYSVTEGFEGDMAKDGPTAGQRALNGWKNAGLPWSYKLDKAKAYFPAVVSAKQ
jgi:rhodanese-related sulfurtransferase